MQKLTASDLSPVVKKAILEDLHKTKEWRSIQDKYERARLKYNLPALQKAKTAMAQMERNALDYYAESLEVEHTNIGALMSSLDEEEKDKINCQLYKIIFACDYLHDILINTDALVKKHFPDAEMVFYTKLKELEQEVNAQIHHVMGKSTQENEDKFFQYSDRIQDVANRYAARFVKQQKRIKEKEQRDLKRRDKDTRTSHQ